MNYIKLTAATCLLFCLSAIFHAGYSNINSLQNNTASSESVDEGRNLFAGKTPFINGGPSCISCHKIDDTELPVSGGTLGINITGFGGLAEDALNERIIEAPYPHMIVMNAAFTGRLVTEEESAKIITYMKYVAEQQASDVAQPLMGSSFLWVGLIGFFLFLGLIWLLWGNRKKGSVNDKIYQRQVQSV